MVPTRWPLARVIKVRLKMVHTQDPSPRSRYWLHGNSESVDSEQLIHTLVSFVTIVDFVNLLSFVGLPGLCSLHVFPKFC